MVRFGILGAGRIAHTFAKALKATSGKLQAVASRDLLRAQAFQTMYTIPRAYDSYEALFNDPHVDVIYIATPHGLHYEQMLKALDYKKALLTEKAFTLNHTQAQAVFHKASQQNVFVMEAMWTRFLPITHALLKRVELGVIGPVKTLAATFSFEGDLSLEGRLMNPELGGGALLDVGIYPLTYADLFGSLDGTIQSDVRLSSTGVDVWNQILIKTPSMRMELESGFLKNRPRHATLTGSKGRIEVPSFWAAEEALIYDDHGTLVEHLHIPHRVNGFEYEIEAVIEDMQAGRSENATMPHAKTLKLLEVMDTLRAGWNVVYPGEKK